MNFKHFNTKLTSPLLSLGVAYIYVFILVVVFYSMGLYKNSTFFNYGIPIDGRETSMFEIKRTGSI